MKITDTIRKMLVNKYVLYLVLFLSITNILGYLASQDFNALTFFIIVAFLTTYFSKNMIIVLLVAMISTNFLSLSHRIPHTIEAMTNKKSKKEQMSNDKKHKSTKMEHHEQHDHSEHDLVEDHDDEHASRKKENLKSRKSLHPASLKPNKVNYQDTIEAAYDNLDKILDSGAVQRMTKDTDKLMNRQDKLASQIEKFVPIIQKAESLISKLPMERMTSMINKLGGMGLSPQKQQ